MSLPATHHATALCWQEIGVLLIGPPASGKSSLAAQMLLHGARLIADDRCVLSLVAGLVLAAPPEALAGVLELRGLGLIRVPFSAPAPIHLVVQDATTADDIPDWRYGAVSLPKRFLQFRSAGAAAQLLLYMQALQEGRVLPEDWNPGWKMPKSLAQARISA